MHARRTIVTVLEDLPSFKPPLDYLLELLPRLQARYYSISSSPKVSQLRSETSCTISLLCDLMCSSPSFLNSLPSPSPPLPLVPPNVCQMYPHSIHITALLVEYKTSTGRTNRGVTTSWLKTLQKRVNNGIVCLHVLFLLVKCERVPH